jgi:hypothetical protein
MTEARESTPIQKIFCSAFCSPHHLAAAKQIFIARSSRRHFAYSHFTRDNFTTPDGDDSDGYVLGAQFAKSS